ncbi:hypothetical protein SLEP1_g13827 [Rubroshorea leprosula]|uniref:Reverse transcriptase Ty1/copia-type domain-containing protein n=1 Tax=Rubroshorea leprosula TaxID=152421 RepID=A0AAV5IH68_9ROSI|nr:hypothetical protein SLEP1_g13827 [Rubroshorea leprosula]
MVRYVIWQDHLHNLCSEGKTVTEYLNLVKLITDELENMHWAVSNEELSVHVMNDLGPEFQEFCAVMRALETPLSFEDFQGRLLAHEESLHHEERRLETIPVVAHHASVEMRNSRGPNAYYSQSGSNFQTTSFVTNQPISAAATRNPIEPSCISQALKDPNWKQAMSDEFTTLVHQGTWGLVPRSLDQNVIGSKWVFWLKCKADGSIECYKARLVAKGFHQQPGNDYSETFSPMIKSTTIKMMLSIFVVDQLVSSLSSAFSLKDPSPLHFFLGVEAITTSAGTQYHGLLLRPQHNLSLHAFDLHFVRELVEQQILRVAHISSKDQLADGSTKPYLAHDFCCCDPRLASLMAPPSCGGVSRKVLHDTILSLN